MPTLAEDRDAIRDLFARYCRYIDTGAVDEWAATFTENGEFLGAGEPLLGRVALRAFASQLPAGTLHHMVLNEAIDVVGDSAICRSSVVVAANGAIVVIGRSDDELRRVDGAWRIARRTFVSDGS